MHIASQTQGDVGTRHALSHSNHINPENPDSDNIMGRQSTGRGEPCPYTHWVYNVHGHI
jgi:hypothetical protein